MFTKEEINKLLEAGRIAKEAREYAYKLCKETTDGLEIAIKVEEFIRKRAEMAFPVNIAIDKVAAHFSPLEPIELEGPVKIDLGANVDGYLSDTAFTFDFSGKYDKLLEAARKALDNVEKMLKPGMEIRQIGHIIESTIREYGYKPIKNLTGHSIERYNLHAGLFIPNYDNGNRTKLNNVLVAIEPFATEGEGIVRNGAPSNILILVQPRRIRDNFARKVLSFIVEQYKTLPFSRRWIIDEFGERGNKALDYLLRQGILYEYPQLIERKAVAQFEHTFLVLDDKVIVTTK